jgi:hypothetical protein
MRRSYPVGFLEDWENVRTLLSEVVQQLGHFPTYQELQQVGYAVLAVAIVDHHSGMHAVRAKMGEAANRVPRGHWLAWENVEAKLRELADELGRAPSHSELKTRGLARLSTAILRVHGGTEAVYARLGIALLERPKDFWRSWSNVESELRRLEESLGRRPTHTDLRAAGWGGAAQAIVRHHGGWEAVCQRLGYSLVSMEDIGAHADALAQVLPLLPTKGQDIWMLMRTRWTKRDLERALEIHQTTGSLTRFEQLLNDSFPVTQD